MKEFSQFDEASMREHWDIVSPLKQRPESTGGSGTSESVKPVRKPVKRISKTENPVLYENWDAVSPAGILPPEAAENRARAKKRRISDLLLKAATYGALAGAFGIYAGGEYVERHTKSKVEGVIPHNPEAGSGVEGEHGLETAEAQKARQLYGSWAEGLFEGEKLVVDTSLDPERAVRGIQIGQFKSKFRNYTLTSSLADGKVFEKSISDEFEISGEEMRNGLKSLPPAWVYMRFKKIDIVNHEIPIPDWYNIKGGSVLAQCERCETVGEAQVTYASSTSTPGEVFSTMPHEIAHGNDCWTSPYMSPRQRQELALQLADRLSSDDRYRSSYVESINNKDTQVQTYLKAREYFAEIVGAFYQDPHSLNVKDARIVMSQLKRGSPGYDCGKGQKNFAAVSSASHDRILKPYFAQLRVQEHAGT